MNLESEAVLILRELNYDEHQKSDYASVCASLKRLVKPACTVCYN